VSKAQETIVSIWRHHSC